MQRGWSATIAIATIGVAIGCSGGESPPDPHVLVACDQGAWTVNGEDIGQCEIGCAMGPSGAPDGDGDSFADDCQATERSPDPCAVIFRADFEGVAGCCFPEVRDTIADSIQRFRVCL